VERDRNEEEGALMDSGGDGSMGAGLPCVGGGRWRDVSRRSEDGRGFIVFSVVVQFKLLA
jgi:hypothetical protein